MINLLDSKFLAWVSKNRATFMLMVLLGGNIYQYIEARDTKSNYEAQIKELQDKLGEMGKENIEYERKRSEELQLLLSNLSKIEDNAGYNNSNSQAHNPR